MGLSTVYWMGLSLAWVLLLVLHGLLGGLLHGLLQLLVLHGLLQWLLLLVLHRLLLHRLWLHWVVLLLHRLLLLVLHRLLHGLSHGLLLLVLHRLLHRLSHWHWLLDHWLLDHRLLDHRLLRDVLLLLWNLLLVLRLSSLNNNDSRLLHKEDRGVIWIEQGKLLLKLGRLDFSSQLLVSRILPMSPNLRETVSKGFSELAKATLHKPDLKVS